MDQGSLVRAPAGAVRCDLEQVIFTPCLVLVKDGPTDDLHGQTVTRLETTVLPVLIPRDLVSRPDNMDETVPHTHIYNINQVSQCRLTHRRSTFGPILFSLVM